VLKRIFDLFTSFLLIVILGPVIIIIATLLFIKQGRPVIFKQQRPGYRGEPFYLYKFRTMKDAFNSKGVLLEDQERLTAFGLWMRKYSLDELPQLLNVLQGNLSFVGPRPLLMEYLDRYNEKQARRHEVKPGVTGWAQVNGRNALSWEDKFELDVWYVDNRSFWLDLKILWMTLIKVLRAEGISGAGTVTMTKFMGNDDGQ
jgi:sugar transferase EpsL